MSQIYDHTQIEEKWLQVWEKRKLFQQSETQKVVDAKSKMYLLFAFAYPSGSGLHVGHAESKTALDILARFYRMNGKQVFFPVGWDAFGLPAENYAIKTGVHPEKTTKDAITTFRRQIKRLGISYDWANEIATCHPEYYRWTQWIFLQLYKKGLAYQGFGMVNWCPSCQTVLANEQVVNGACERCGSTVIQKEMKQWYFKITEYKDELISGLDQVDWPAATKQQQLNWIGKSEGLSIGFTFEPTGQVLPVWTKFWETVFGVTFVVIAPEKFKEWNMIEHVSEEHKQTVLEYLEQASHKTEEERQIGAKDKTGVDTGLQMVNPATGGKVPLYIADYVLSGVGTGVVMGVPAHDDRDFEFAKKFSLPSIQVVSYPENEILNQKVALGVISHEGDGVLTNSGKFDGQQAWGDGKQDIAAWLVERSLAGWETTYKLRDWLISRQRYWGAPIPIVYDPEGKPHQVKEEHLPWMLPTDVDFKPTGESPLKSSKEFIERTEKLYGKGWRPEFDTMDTFVDSSWYFLRYVDSRNQEVFADPGQLKSWLPVDFYMIGPEHIVLHLLYSRFFTKFLRDEGYLSFDEPFKKMRHQGMILGPDGRKMSKSKGNVINPDDVIEKFGTDTLRVYEMFMGPIDADKPWDVRAVAGVYRFLTRIFDILSTQSTQNLPEEDQVGKNIIRQKIHQTISKVTQDITEYKYNTAIAAMMEMLNVWEQHKSLPVTVQDCKAIVKILAPFAPFLAEELYQKMHVDLDEPVSQKSVHEETWPVFDPTLVAADSITIAIQVNGKLRGEITIDAQLKDDQSKVLELAKQDEKIKIWLQTGKLVKEIYIPGRVINFVVVS